MFNKYLLHEDVPVYFLVVSLLRFLPTACPSRPRIQQTLNKSPGYRGWGRGATHSEPGSDRAPQTWGHPPAAAAGTREAGQAAPGRDHRPRALGEPAHRAAGGATTDPSIPRNGYFLRRQNGGILFTLSLYGKIVIIPFPVIKIGNQW